ncbi:hypothetical protein TeGR_g12252, partial [Tetraparma gracilis]
MAWWRSLTSDDPITLEPLCSLPVPPFSLHSHLFSAVPLALYLTERAVFLNPLTRQPLARADCRALDEHLRRYHPGEPASVASCFEVHARVKISDPGLRSAVSTAASSLFSYRSWEL